MGRLLAQYLGYRFLDTGAMYRAITWLAMDRGVDIQDEKTLVHLAQSCPITVDSESNGIRLDGRKALLEEQRTAIDQNVSLVARIPGVRKALVKQQQALGREGRIVMVGRDIGTVVLPQAPLKLFFQASPRERARRRHSELQDRGHKVDLDRVLEDVESRDRLDTQRAHSPLRPATDAHLIDTEGQSIEQVLESLLELVEGVE